MPMEKTGIKQLLDYIETTDLEYVSLEKNGRKFSFSRSVSPTLTKNSTAVSEKSETPETPKLVSIRSPIVGRFYSATRPDRPPLVVEGGHITNGQRVAIVEAMKIRKEVFSTVTGTIVRMLLRDGDPVEYGQELYSVEPEVSDTSKT